jgi:hypothetical protein
VVWAWFKKNPVEKTERDIHLIPPNELNPLLANFLLTVRKKMDVISSHAPCDLSIVVLTGSYDEQNMDTQSLAQE